MENIFFLENEYENINKRFFDIIYMSDTHLQRVVVHRRDADAHGAVGSAYVRVAHPVQRRRRVDLVRQDQAGRERVRLRHLQPLPLATGAQDMVSLTASIWSADWAHQLGASARLRHLQLLPLATRTQGLQLQGNPMLEFWVGDWAGSGEPEHVRQCLSSRLPWPCTRRGTGSTME